MGKTRKNEKKIVDKIKSGSHSLNPGTLKMNLLIIIMAKIFNERIT